MRESGQSVQISWAGEHHLRLGFDTSSGLPILDRLDRALAAIKRAPPPGLVGITPASSTILLEFDLEHIDETHAIEKLRQVLNVEIDATPLASRELIEIPVCYDASFAPDAAEVARLHDITPVELIQLHCAAEYVVQFIGFVPGFGYLSGLPAQLITPRLDAPRPRVPAGSVGIAGDQTGVYPGNTAGGWRLIGRTPLRMFDPGRERPSLLARGDRVRFVPISLAEFGERQRELSCHG